MKMAYVCTSVQPIQSGSDGLLPDCSIGLKETRSEDSSSKKYGMATYFLFL